MQEFLDNVITWATSTGIKVLVSLIVLFISFRVINWLSKLISKKLTANEKLDLTLVKTLCNVVTIGLKVLVLVCLIGYLGIETSGLSALIASLGVCIGLAVNGTLGNLAGGVMLLLTRPFSVGDYVSAQGSEGTVDEIRICHTKIHTVDNKVIYLPNGSLSAGNITNYSEKELRRVDLTFSVAGNDPALVRKVLLDECAKDAKIKADPEPFARITDFGAGNGVKITLRAWCASADYWDVYLALLENLQKRFEAEGIVVPFNQLDVHLKNN